MASERTISKALDTLDTMREVARNDALQPGMYVWGGVDKRRLKAGAPCGGHNVCLIGDALVSYGVRTPDVPAAALPDRRADFASRRPALKLVYRALDRAAERLVSRRPEMETDDLYLGPEIPGSYAEGVFESHYRNERNPDGPLARGDMLRLIGSARRLVEGGEVTLA